jgi:hypothetical protein
MNAAVAQRCIVFPVSALPKLDQQIEALRHFKAVAAACNEVLFSLDTRDICAGRIGTVFA